MDVAKNEATLIHRVGREKIACATHTPAVTCGNNNKGPAWNYGALVEDTRRENLRQMMDGVFFFPLCSDTR
jgi:hypothetical protein